MKRTWRYLDQKIKEKDKISLWADFLPPDVVDAWDICISEKNMAAKERVLCSFLLTGLCSLKYTVKPPTMPLLVLTILGLGERELIATFCLFFLIFRSSYRHVFETFAFYANPWCHIFTKFKLPAMRSLCTRAEKHSFFSKTPCVW